jgi:hypothetical protein
MASWKRAAAPCPATGMADVGVAGACPTRRGCHAGCDVPVWPGCWSVAWVNTRMPPTGPPSA